MRHAGQFTCIVCAKVSEKVIVTSAAAEIPNCSPVLSTNKREKHLLENWKAAPPNTENPPSLHQLRHIATTLSSPVLGRSDYHSDIDNQCRLAVAQLLKDIQYPRHQLPDPAKTVVAAVLSEGVGNKVLRYDLLELLLSLLIDSGMDSSLSDNLLRRIVCSPFAEKLGKRLVDEGYDWRVLKRKFSRNEKRRWWYDDTVRVRLLEYSKQRLVAKPKTDIEDEIS
jgi:hypothetical protein